MSFKDLTHLIERMEPVEDRMGVRLQGLIASAYEDVPENTIDVSGEMCSTAGGELERALAIQIVAHNAVGQVVGLGEVLFWPASFTGYIAFSKIVRCKVPPTRIKVVPTWWRGLLPVERPATGDAPTRPQPGGDPLPEQTIPTPRVPSKIAGLDVRRKGLLGHLLLSNGSITEDQLELALAEQRRTRNLLGEVLIGLGFATEQRIAEAVSLQTGIPLVQVSTEPLSPHLLKVVPEDVCRRHRLVPLGAEGSVLRLAMANPFDVMALNYFRTMTTFIPFPSIAPWGDILKRIEEYYPRKGSHPGVRPG